MAKQEQEAPETQEATAEVEAGADVVQAEVTDADDQAVFDKKVQSLVDKRVTDALKKQEARLNEEYARRIADEQARQERANLEANGEYQKLHQQTQAELDDLRASVAQKDFYLEASRWLQQEGLSLHTNAIMRGASNLDEVKDNAKAFNDAVASAIEDGVRKALDTGPPRTPLNTTPTPAKSPDQMSADEFEVYKKARGLV